MNNTEENESTFHEILSEEADVDTRRWPTYIDAYIAIVPPSECSALVKKVGRTVTETQSQDFSLDTDATIDLSHLRRVRRRQVALQQGDHNAEENSTQDKPSSDKATSLLLELAVMLGPVIDVDRQCQANNTTAHQYFLSMFGVTNLAVAKVPAYPAESKQQLEEFYQYWPTVYFPNKTREHARLERRLTAEQVQQMQQGMEAALADADAAAAYSSSCFWGAVILDPQSGQIVSRAHEENMAQASGLGKDPSGQTSGVVSIMSQNPLATPILLAIQGVSRREREMACTVGMDHPSFHQGQYLCTGFDCYTVREPTAFEAMALVHARIRHVVFGTATQSGGILEYKIHNLPNTNHRFRAFVCTPDSELSQRARQEYSVGDTGTC